MAYIKREAIEEAAEKVGLDVVERMEDAVMKGDYTLVFVLAFMLAGAADFNVLSSVPLLGLFFDVMTVTLLAVLLYSFNSFIATKVKIVRAVLYFLEFIPAIDALPFWTTAAFLTWYRVKRAARDGRQGLEQIHNHGTMDDDKLEKFG